MGFGIYIHVPFCKSKCPYCDFYSLPDDDDLKTKYVDALVAEILGFKDYLRGEGRDGLRLLNSGIDSIYFGGGTPNLLRREQFERIFDALREVFLECGGDGINASCCSGDGEGAGAAVSSESPFGNAEVTIEVNPKTIDRQGLVSLRGLPFNRLSIGVQSFDDNILKKLGRLHKSADNRRIIRDAVDAGFDNISIDLMFGIEGQTYGVWMDTVKTAAELMPQHISLYSLEFASGTVFTRWLEEGRMRETDHETDRRMYEDAIEFLECRGYCLYEISNLSRLGSNEQNCERGQRDFRSKHNLKYWNLEEYIGFGPNAHSYVLNMNTGNGRRYYHEADIEKYLADPSAVVFDGENTLADDIEEYMITALRRTEGISKPYFKSRFGIGIWEYYGDKKRKRFEFFVDGGFAEEDEEGMRLTLGGFNISNRILSIFV